MKKKIKFFKQISEPIYGVTINIAIGDHELVATKINLLYKDDDIESLDPSPNWNAYFLKLLTKETGVCVGYLLWAKDFDWSIQDQGTLAHEIYHLVSFVLGDRGLTHSTDSDEAYAYYYAYWFRKVWGELKNLESKE